MAEWTGILRGTGAKVKASLEGDTVVFRGMLKAKAPKSEVSAEARGTLLVLSYKEHVVELAVGGKAASIAATINRG